MWAWLFPPEPTVAERLKENRKRLSRAQRELTREREKLERQEPQMKRRMKEMAQKQQMEAAKLVAKNLIRHRNAVSKFYRMEIQLDSTLTNLQLIKSSTAMANAMRETVRAMYIMNRQVPLPAMMEIMKEFERQNEFMEMKQEMMDETIDGVVEGDDDEELEAAAINAVLEEIGIETVDGMGLAEKKKRGKEELNNNNNFMDKGLSDRIDNLKK